MDEVGERKHNSNNNKTREGGMEKEEKVMLKRKGGKGEGNAYGRGDNGYVRRGGEGRDGFYIDERGGLCCMYCRWTYLRLKPLCEFERGWGG